MKKKSNRKSNRENLSLLEKRNSNKFLYAAKILKYEGESITITKPVKIPNEIGIIQIPYTSKCIGGGSHRRVINKRDIHIIDDNIMVFSSLPRASVSSGPKRPNSPKKRYNNGINVIISHKASNTKEDIVYVKKILDEENIHY